MKFLPAFFIRKIQGAIPIRFKSKLCTLLYHFVKNYGSNSINPLIFINAVITHYSFYLKHNIFFIQIGSNDGKTGDPLYPYIVKYHWKGLLVEPSIIDYRNLKHTYKGFSGLQFDKHAIAKINGKMKFYYFDSTINRLYPWSRQLGSLKKSVIEKHLNLIPNSRKNISSKFIRCISFNSLLARHKIKRFDFLAIDTEGFDFEIIKQINFSKWKPFLILYENIHLNDFEKVSCYKLLKKEGYKFISYGYNVLAYL